MKKIIAFILVLSLCFAFVSCNLFKKDKTDEKSDENQRRYEDKFVAAAAGKMKVSYTDTKNAGYLAFLDKLDRFAAKLTYEIYADSDKQSNIAISPVSVYMALALAAECSNGETRNEILNAVGVTYEEVSSFTKMLYSLCNNEYYYWDESDSKKISGFLELANSIWADKDVVLSNDGVNNLANNYNCDLFEVDFSTDEGKNAISDYIKEKTHGLIDGNIDLSSETLITLINTFYLKDVWNDYGKNLGFTDSVYSFVNADGSITETKLLRGYYNNGRVYEGEGYTSFFTTTEHNITIKFIVPNDGYTLEDVFTEENIYDFNNVESYGYVDHENKQRHHTRVFFPEYEASYDGEIKDVLHNDFGINDLFSRSECNFTGITDEPVYCDTVIHKCNLKVDKTGIEGAAITAVIANGAAAPDEYEDVYHDYIVDRAFGFVIVDSYGSVLFAGVINNIE